MKRQPPYGSTDPDEPYLDRNMPVEEGSAVPASFFEWTQNEIIDVIEEAGIEPDDVLQLADAIKALGKVATVEIAQKNPVFPEILATGNVFTFTTSTGQIIVASAIEWQHRGLSSFDSANILSAGRTFATTASKTYHLVWDAPGTGDATPAGTYPNGRFQLIDRTGASPAEGDPSYDSTFDRMLIARVVTNGANALTVTALRNKAVLKGDADISATPVLVSGNGYRAEYAPSWNWARTPNMTFNAFVVATSIAGVGGEQAGVEGGANYTNVFSRTRYGASVDVLTDWNSNSNVATVSSSLKYGITA